jgi:hypothetical protein
MRPPLWLSLLPLLAACAGQVPPNALSSLRPGGTEMLTPAADGRPLLTLGAGVPYNGCILNAETVYDGAGGGSTDCAVTMSGLLGVTPAVATR